MNYHISIKSNKERKEKKRKENEISMKKCKKSYNNKV